VSTHGRLRIAAVGCGLALLAASACGSNDEEKPEPADTTTPPTTAAPTVFPLRGTPVDEPGRAGRPALVVKIDNDARARPQGGVAEADLVVEEKVEGPHSRFAAVFHSTDPASVGPVRSGRSTDVAIVAGLNRPLFAFSGANPTFLAQLRSAPLVDVGVDAVPDAYERRAGRPAPYNLWAVPERLRAAGPDDTGPPPAAFVYGDDAPGGADVIAGAVLNYDFGPAGTRVSFSWDATVDGYVRTQDGSTHVDADGRPLAPANVVVQLVEYIDTGERDVVGTPVPEARLTGEGDAWVLTRDVAVRATWSRPEGGGHTELRRAGEPVALAPGQTWLALVPIEGAGVTVAPPG
jgi:hypothetical protein